LTKPKFMLRELWTFTGDTVTNREQVGNGKLEGKRTATESVKA